jgi:membrane protease YdiL (CAAX protease family)
MTPKQNLLSLSLIVLIVWMVIVFGGELLQAGQGSLEALTTEQSVIALIVAPLFLFGVIAYFKWNKRELGLKAAQNWHLLWLPALFVLAFLGAAIALGLPPAQMVIFALINSLLVGVSEELMFRGIMFRGALAQPQFKIWPAIWLTAIVFGAIHALNGFMTGDFVAALVQALAATMSGLWVHAIRLRTKSLYPAMLIHGLWDFALFVFVTSIAAMGATAAAQGPVEPTLAQKLVIPLLMPLPLFLYGLWLLRGIGQQDKEALLS